MKAQKGLASRGRKWIRETFPNDLIDAIDLEEMLPESAESLLKDTIETFVYAIGRTRSREISKLLEDITDRLDITASS